MSLLSVHNFTAPLKSTTHLILLVLVALLFATYRYSGGSISTARNSSVRQSSREELIIPSRKSTAESAPKSNKRDFLEEVMSGEEQRSTKESSLDDVEKKLGLR